MRRAAPFLAVLGLLVAGSCTPPAQELSDPVVVYLVRHAERAEDGTNNPPISEEGQARAELLATMLRDAGITQVHTTDYLRTRQTGAPLLTTLGREAEVYDPRDLVGFAARLRGTQGRHLVLGHSNTTPDLVTALGGDAGSPIEEMEYDRLYVVVVPGAGPVSTTLLRYGAGT